MIEKKFDKKSKSKEGEGNLETADVDPNFSTEDSSSTRKYLQSNGDDDQSENFEKGCKVILRTSRQLSAVVWSIKSS